MYLLLMPVLEQVCSHRPRDQPSHRPQRSAPELVPEETSARGAHQRRADSSLARPVAGSARWRSALVAGVGVGAGSAGCSVAAVGVGRIALLLRVALTGIFAVLGHHGLALVVSTLLVWRWLLTVRIVLVLGRTWLVIFDDCERWGLKVREAAASTRVTHLRWIAAILLLLPAVAVLRGCAAVLVVSALAMLRRRSAIWSSTRCGRSVLRWVTALRRRIAAATIVFVGHAEISRSSKGVLVEGSDGC